MNPCSLISKEATVGPFVFLSTFKWELRKGWDRLLEAYIQVCIVV